MRDREHSITRKCAQLKQQIRESKCIHPNECLRIVLIADGGFIEYCVACMKITQILEN